MQQSLLIEGPLKADKLIERVNRLVKLARSSDNPVFFVKDTRVEPNPNVHISLKPLSTDVIIEKDYCDSFHETLMHAKLQSMAIDRLVIAGLQTDYCIDTTCRRAISKGYDVILVGDAHSTFDNEYLSAKQIINHHNRVLHGLSAANGSVSVLESSEIKF